jgi:hypothetical protein
MRASWVLHRGRRGDGIVRRGRIAAIAGALALAAGVPPVLANSGVGSEFELVFWQSVASSNDRVQFEAYLAQYPDGTFSALARAKIAAMDRLTGRSGGDMPAAAPARLMNASAVMHAPAAPPLSGAPPAQFATRFPALPPVPPSTPPAVIAAPVAMVTAPAAVPVPAPAAAPVAALAASVPPVPAAAPGAAAPAPEAAPAAELTLSEQLRALGQSQTVQGIAAPLMHAGAALPARPQLTKAPRPALPASFCSAEERNSFYDTVYKPSLELADQDNRTTIAHMSRLQQAYEEQLRRSDTNAANVLAAEAKEYEAVAKAVFTERASYEAIFNRFMGLPLVLCGSRQ